MNSPLPQPGPAAVVPDLDAMYEASYAELRRVAHARLHRGGRNTVLDTTALVHESYLRLSRQAEVAFPDRARFLVYAGRAMRSIVVDLVREAQAQRRGSNAVHISITCAGADELPQGQGEACILGVHAALQELAGADPRMAQVVEMKYFAGMTEAEIAQALGVTDRTVRRDWEQARLFLADALR